MYTGITTDLKRRLDEHRRGIASRYTRAKGFKALRHQETHLDRSKASAREYEIKQLSRTAKIQLIEKPT